MHGKHVKIKSKPLNFKVRPEIPPKTRKAHYFFLS